MVGDAWGRAAVLGIVLFMLCVPGAWAGPWLRGEGEGFTSIAGTFRQSQDAAEAAAILPYWDGKLFVEYGVTPWLTMGLDGYETGYTYGHLILFARVPLSPQAWRLRVAGELGLGQFHNATGEWNTMSKLGLSVGQGFEFDWSGEGWWALDAAVEQRVGQEDRLWKLDATLGANIWPRLRPMLKIETAYLPGDPFIWAINPAVRLPTETGLVWVAGVEYRSVAGLGAAGVKIETWWLF